MNRVNPNSISISINMTTIKEVVIMLSWMILFLPFSILDSLLYASVVAECLQEKKTDKKNINYLKCQQSFKQAIWRYFYSIKNKIKILICKAWKLPWCEPLIFYVHAFPFENGKFTVYYKINTCFILNNINHVIWEFKTIA